MLQNGDFAAGTSGWFGYPTGASGIFSTDATTFHSAPAAARIDVAGVGPGGEFKVWQDPIPLQALQSYTLSFWARASTPQQIQVHFYSENCPALRCWNDREFCVGTSWSRYEISFASTGTASAGLNLFVHEPGTVWLDDVSLRTGDTTLYRRDFDNGVALLNYTNVPQTVDLGGTFWRLRIEGHPVFDGAPVVSEMVPPSDARIVMRDSVPPLPPDTSTTSDVAPPPGARNALWQNVPNPFNPTTEVRFSLAREERATLAVYDVAGRRVRRLFEGRVAPGTVQRALWDGRDAQGRPLPSGIYLLRLDSPSWRESRKMVLLR
jgi:hypothetical protein